MGFLLWPGSGSAPCCQNCGGSTPEGCDNCSTGFAPRKLKLVVPAGTFIDPGGFGGGPGPCPDPGCGFYAGTYLFDMMTTPQTAGCDPTSGGCCAWFLCFDGPASGVDCDCALPQAGDSCKQFCVVNVSVLPPDGIDSNYRIEVGFSSGAAEESICGDCHFATGRTIFRKEFTTDPPDCMSWNNLEVPLNPAGFTFGTYCIAGSSSSVFVSAA